MRKSLLSATILFASLQSALAAVDRGTEQRANQLLSMGKPLEVVQLLRPRIGSSDSAQTWFLMGKASEQIGDLNGAAVAYRQVLARDPNAQRVKLDLARVLAARNQGDDASNAERLLREVRATNPPAQVAANIDRFLSMMQNRDAVGSAWRARATVGAGYDSNVNQATSAREVRLFGLPFTLSRDARKMGSAYMFFKGELDHIYRFNREFAWTSNLTFGARRNFNVQNFDSYTINAATGPVWQPGDKTTVLLPVFVNVMRYENERLKAGQRFYSNEFGIAPQVRYALTDAISANLTTSIARKHLFESQDRNSTVVNVSPGFDFRTASFGTFTVGASFGREISRQSTSSNRSIGGNLGWQYAFSNKLVGSVYGQYADSRYDAQEAAYDEKRRDKRTTLGLDLIYTWDWIGADILLSYAHTRNVSNIPLYSYTKDTASLAVRKAF
jgi:outer membrane protein